MSTLLRDGLRKVTQNKRYIFWFWLLNLTLAEFGASGFRRAAHAILDRSLYAERLVKGFDLAVFLELLSKPEFGTLNSMTYPSLYFGLVFFLATAVFLPGVFTGYASMYRLPREEFFRACGRNLWRFIRIMIIAAIVMGIVGGLLFAANSAIVKKADESTNEKLPFELQMTGFALMFLVMTTLRIWFDLTEVDVVLNDQAAVRKSIVAALRHTFRSLARLLTGYVVVTIVAMLVLAAGVWLWMKLVAPENIVGAFAMGQITLFLLLVPRFWQRGMAVSYWQRRMIAPFVPTAIGEPSLVPVAVAPESPAPDVPPASAPPAEPQS